MSFVRYLYNTQYCLLFSSNIWNLKESVLERSKLAELAYEMGWNEAKILQNETISRYRKGKEPVHIVCLTYPISHTRCLLFENLDEQEK